jgi:hypothetical protein
MGLMGVREYGRHRGVSHVAVLKAIRSGRIRQTRDGLIDCEKADRDWLRNTHPAPRARRAVPVQADSGYSLARTMREVYLARLARLEFEQRDAALLNADEVRVAEFTVLESFRRQMLAIPDALDTQIAAEASASRMYELLSGAIRQALASFADQHSPAHC